jgi:probable HAF family extracellular repeat protein
MRVYELVCSAAALLATMAVPVRMIAQDGQVPTQNHRRYKLIDIGTFGGPNSSFVLPSPGGRLLNNSGAAAGGADTSTPDPSSCFNFDCYLSYGFKWQDGVADKLSALPGFNSSFTFWISDTGLVAGLSENGIDPLTGSLAQEAILWGNDGTITDLGTLGGNDSVAGAVNNRSQVAGGALNTIPDPYSSRNFFISGATQVHAFRWTKSQGMQDLGTLGGTDSNAFEINNRGQIAGWSFTNSTVNPVTGIPNLDPFFWENGKMLDMGTLGGTVALSYALNDRGQVSGRSNMAGDLTCHPFLWDQNRGMQDLGTLGGDSGFATWLNDAGEVVGVANLPGVSGCDDGASPHHAFLWKKGVMTDLGTADGDPCSYAVGINSKGQVVGSSTDCTNYVHASLWEDGGPMVDLNSLILPNSGVQLTLALYINDSGEIAAHGTLSNGDQHAFLLIPCGSGDSNAGCSAEGGDSTMVPQMTLGARETVSSPTGPSPRRSTSTRLNR